MQQSDNVRYDGQRRLTSTLSLCVWLVISSLWGTTALAQLQHRHAIVRLEVGSKSGNLVYLPFDIARALHYFDDEGLDVRVKYGTAGATAAEDLGSGRVDFSCNSLDHAIEPRPAGAHLKMVASFTDLPAVTLVIRRDLRSKVQSIHDLRGRRLGLTVLGSGTHVIAAAILRSAGLSLQDVTVISVGSDQSLIAAMRSGQIDAAVTVNLSTIDLLLTGQASLLLDMDTYQEAQRVFKGGYQFTGLLTRDDMIQKNPELVQRMVNAIVRSNRFIATHSAVEIAAALPASLVGDHYVYVKSLEHVRPAFSKTGKISLQAVDNTLHAKLAFTGPSSVTPPEPSSLFDMKFVNDALTRMTF
jgi:NitT/TauT family transport system substrate-binding protein